MENINHTHSRFNLLLSVSILAMAFCYINASPLILALLELLIAISCFFLFKYFNIGQLKCFQNPCPWYWKCFHWYWALYFALTPLLNMINSGSEHIKIFDYLFPARYCLSWHSLWILLNKAFCSHCVLLTAVLLTAPLWYALFRWLFYYIVVFFQNLSRSEWTYLIPATVLLIASLVLISSKTSFFAYPVDSENYKSEDGVVIHYQFDSNEDHFLDTDTGGLLEMPFYTIGDQSRHPYFSRVISLFFPLLLLLGSIFNLFIKSYAYSFALGISAVQVILYVITGILIKRIYSQITNSYFSTLISVFYICSFPVVFVFCPERLIFSSFFVVLSIYLIIYSQIENLYISIVMFLTIGTTSLSLLPISLACLFKKKISCIVLSVLPLCLLTIHNGADWWLSNTAHLETTSKTTSQRISSYNQLLESCFFVSEWKAVNISKRDMINPDGKTTTISPKIIIQNSLDKSRIRANITGIIIFALTCLSVYYYRKETVVQISFFWILVSVGLVGLMGFGNSRCVLYNTYFSWAVLPLALLPFNWLCQKGYKIPVIVILYGVAAFLVVCNIYFICQIYQIVGARYIIPPGI
ncbi:MAG: hypothetical protein IJQ39_02465 [Thermoguttaceae bacterium]|nr:hypothetical protein [Thermoguttaceae bacterium]